VQSNQLKVQVNGHFISDVTMCVLVWVCVYVCFCVCVYVCVLAYAHVHVGVKCLFAYDCMCVSVGVLVCLCVCVGVSMGVLFVMTEHNWMYKAMCNFWTRHCSATSWCDARGGGNDVTSALASLVAVLDFFVESGHLVLDITHRICSDVT